jgi:hypothetical protein
MQSSVTPENLASSAKQTVRPEWGPPAALVRKSIDLDTNTVRMTTQEAVLSADVEAAAAAAVDVDGSYSEVQPVNTLWSIKTTQQAAGLAGAPTKSREYEIVVNYTWPAVYNYSHIRNIPGPDGSSIAAVAFVPVLLRDEYSGPCLARVEESWSLSEPIIVPNAPMLPRSMEFNGQLFAPRVGPTLHTTQFFREQVGTNGNGKFGPYIFEWSYPETNYTDWPEEILASVDVTPAFGGFNVRKLYVKRPNITAAINQIRALVTEVTGDSFVLEWGHNLAGTPDFLIEVATDPSFKSGILTGYKPALAVGNVATATITGMVRGKTYYLRVKHTSPAAVSNVVTAVTRPTPEIQVEEPAGTILVDGSSSISFGTVLTGYPLVKTFVIRNIGELPLNELVITKDGTHQADYTISALTDTTLEAGASMSFTVSFNPGASGTRTAALHIASDDETEAPFDIALTGLGVKQEIQVEQPVSTILVTGVSTKDFGSVNTGSTSSLTFTITNVGDGVLSSIAASLSGLDAAQFSITSAPSATLAPAATTTCVVRCAPNIAGSLVAALNIANDDADESPYVIGLTATGVGAPELVVEGPLGNSLTGGVSTVNYGTLAPLGSGVAQTFTIRNMGILNLTSLVVTAGGTHAADLTVGALGSTTVGPGDSTTFNLTFTPASAGVRSASISIASNDADENPFVIALTAFGGIAQEIQVEQPAANVLTDGATTVAWGQVFAGASSVKTFVIRNMGNLDLTTISASVVGTNAGDWTVGTLSSANLAPGASRSFDVTYTPGGNGARVGTLQIVSNDGDENPFDIPLTATGVPVPGFLTYQEASVAIGQMNLVTADYECTDTLVRSGAGVAVSSLGAFAMVDTHNHRVLLWNSVPTSNGTPANVVLGQPDFTSSMPNRGGGATNNTLDTPIGVAFNPAGTKLIVADSSNNRVLIWNTIPTTNGASANLVLGQSTFSSVTTGLSSIKYNYPSSVYVSASNVLFVTDTGNNRVLKYNALPTTSNAAANIVIGQTAMSGATSGATNVNLHLPQAVFVHGTKLFVADYFNNRVLIWNTIPTANGAAADTVLGQANFTSGGLAVSQSRMYGAASVAVSAGGVLAVFDASNNRVLIWYAVPTTNGAPADAVLGQADFVSNSYFAPGGTPTGRNMWGGLGRVVFDGADLIVSSMDMRRAMIFKPIS